MKYNKEYKINKYNEKNEIFSKDINFDDNLLNLSESNNINSGGNLNVKFENKIIESKEKLNENLKINNDNKSGNRKSKKKKNISRKKKKKTN